MVVENLRIDVTPGGVPLVIHVSQYDAGLRQFNFTPYDKGVQMAKIAGASVTMEATKPDGYAVQHPCTYNSDGTITYVLQEQLAAVEGQVWSKLTWRDGNGKILGAKAIVWAVDMAGIEDGAIVSDSDIPLIEEAAQFAATYEEKVAEMIAQMQIKEGQVVIDGTLTVPGAAADAKVTGDEISDIKHTVGKMKIVPGLSGEAKDALLSCFEHLAWSDDQGLTLYNALFDALYPSTYTLDEPFVCDGVSDFIVTPVALLRKDRSYTILADFTEDVEFNESTNMYVCRLYDLRNGAEISLRDYRVSSANDRVRATWSVTTGRWVAAGRVATSGHRHIKAALSHVQGEHTFISAMSIDGVAATPDGISSLTYDPTLVTNVPLVIGATVGVDGVISRYFKGTIHGFQILDTAYTQSECDQYVLSTTV